MFIDIELESVLGYLNKLDPAAKPGWGNMGAQRMVEHLTDTLRIATGKNPQKQVIPDEKLEGMLRFLDSDKPMARGIAVDFATPEMQLRHEEIELAVDEFVEEWLEFEELYTSHPDHTEVHPYYGPMNYKMWLRLHQKHLTHHFEQFGLL